MITPDSLLILLPRAVAWAERQEESILREGVPLTATLLADASAIGLQHPGKVRLRVVLEIPMPDYPRGLTEQTAARVRKTAPQWDWPSGSCESVRNNFNKT
jgi:hypothetical protein